MPTIVDYSSTKYRGPNINGSLMQQIIENHLEVKVSNGGDNEKGNDNMNEL